jgi:chromosomal replication initiation ATPase DnaA
MSNYKKFISLLDAYNDNNVMNKKKANELNKMITNHFNNEPLYSDLGYTPETETQNLYPFYFPILGPPSTPSQYSLWQNKMEVSSLPIHLIDPASVKTKVCTIDISVNSISDLIAIVDKYPVQLDTQYNIDLENLHKIKLELTKLNDMIGMDDMKQSIVNQLLYFIQNLHIGTNGSDFKHTVLCGPPGTGKTEIAHIIGQMYSKIGILKKNKFRKVTRNDLIAGYLGQTAIKTKQVITDCLGGVLFIDEAYSLASHEHNDSFSKECLDILCEALSEHKDDLMVIIAGYEDELNETFFRVNPGLTSRFIWRFAMQPYTMKELVNIFNKMIIDQEWQLDKTFVLTEKWFYERKNNFSSYGRDIEALITYIKIAHGRRIYGDLTAVKKCITNDDLMNGYKHFVSNKKQDKKPVFGLYV